MKVVSILGEGGEGALSSVCLSFCLQVDEESQPIQHERASYELLSNAPPSVDQLAYWLAHKEQFCILSHLASQDKSIGLRH